LTGEEAGQVSALSVLEAVTSIRPDFINFLAAECIQLSSSPNMLVRLMAAGLREPLHLKAKEIDKARRDLPVTYSLKLPEVVMPEYVLPLAFQLDNLI
jgi:hypothetical protein